MKNRVESLPSEGSYEHLRREDERQEDGDGERRRHIAQRLMSPLIGACTLRVHACGVRRSMLIMEAISVVRDVNDPTVHQAGPWSANGDNGNQQDQAHCPQWL